MFYVYIIQSEADKNFYTGFTRNLEKRIIYHNSGLNNSTKYRRPFKLIYCEAYINEKDARVREKFLKSGRGREIIKKQLDNTLRV